VRRKLVGGTSVRERRDGEAGVREPVCRLCGAELKETSVAKHGLAIPGDRIPIEAVELL